MVNRSHVRSLRTIAAIMTMVVAIALIFGSNAWSQTLRDTPNNVFRASDPAGVLKSIDDLMHERLDREIGKYGNKLSAEQIRLEANYVRTDAPTGEVVLHEASFALQPRYMSFSPEGHRQTDTSALNASRPVMYFIGSARTPLSLPVVSPLSRVLSGEEASYTVYIGVLPLPRVASVGSAADSLRFYCIIERAIESNRTDREVKFERYAKEFAVKIGDPVRLRLENTPPDKKAYIVRLDDNQTLDFYEDFARHFKEDIILNGERLYFSLKKATISPVSTRLSIPYTVAYPAHVKLDLLSVVDPAHPLTLVDSVMPPADYLAEKDMRPYPNGTYRYRLVVNELGSNKVVFEETKDIDKNQALVVGSGMAISGADTLEVGGEKRNAAEIMNALNTALMIEKSKSERLDATLQAARSDNEKLQHIVEAQKESSIAGLRFRAGGGIGTVPGYNLFIGVQSSVPSLSLDLSYGLMYSVPYLAYESPSNFSQIFTSPKSLGLTLGWEPFQLVNGVINAVAKFGYYGIYSSVTESTKNGIHSATIIAPSIGISSTPGGVGTDFGIDVTVGPAFGLGVNGGAQFNFQSNFYVKF